MFLHFVYYFTSQLQGYTNIHVYTDLMYSIKTVYHLFLKDKIYDTNLIA